MCGSKRLENRYNNKAAIAYWLHQKLPPVHAVVQREGHRKASSSDHEEDGEGESVPEEDSSKHNSKTKKREPEKERAGVGRKKPNQRGRRQGGSSKVLTPVAGSDSKLLQDLVSSVSDLRHNQTQIANAIESIFRGFNSHLIRHDKGLENLVASDQKVCAKISSLESCIKQLASHMGRSDLGGSGPATRLKASNHGEGSLKRKQAEVTDESDDEGPSNRNDSAENKASQGGSGAKTRGRGKGRGGRARGQSR